MIEIPYKLRKGESTTTIHVRISDVVHARDASSPAPWDVAVRILWGEEIAFDRPLAGMDPLHAVNLATQFAAQYIEDRAREEGDALEPPIYPFHKPSAEGEAQKP